MALQLKGGSYGLRQAGSSNKTALLMKLTDSALRIIESYQDHPGSARSQPTIQFHGNQGVIRIPIPGGDPDVQEFTFQVANLTQSAGVDCLQQIRSGQTGRIECLGSIQKKVTVNATDDSYNMTRQRMTLAKEEEQKISTKVIKQPGSKRGKVFKKSTVKGRIVEKKHHSVGRLSPDARASTPPVSRLTPTQMLNNRSSSPLTIPHKDNASSPPGVPGSGRNKTKPMMSISSGSTSQPSSGGAAASSQPAVAARPLWDRVAHLLAVRPYKYPEIVLRLTRDKAPDKNRLQTILREVATSRNTPGGSLEYCLSRPIYGNIEVDWPGYSEGERQTVKKRLAEFNSSSDSRKRSYGATLPPSDVVADDQEDQYSNPTSKKQRVSHYKKPSPPQPTPASPAESDRAKPAATSPSAGITFGTAKLPSVEKAKESRHSSKHHHEDSVESSHERQSGKHSSNHSSVKNSSSKHAKSARSEKHKSQQNNASENVNPDDDFLTRYTQISSVEQRDRYKQDFKAEYQEYLLHHSNVAAVSGKFAEMQRKLNEQEKGSEEYKAISRQVIQEYKEIKKNDAYHHERERMQFLHRKLQHIKGLVNDFDKHRLANRSENEPGLCMPTKTATRVGVM